MSRLHNAPVSDTFSIFAARRGRASSALCSLQIKTLAAYSCTQKQVSIVWKCARSVRRGGIEVRRIEENRKCDGESGAKQTEIAARQ